MAVEFDARSILFSSGWRAQPATNVVKIIGIISVGGRSPRTLIAGDDASYLGCTGRPPQGPVVRLRPPRHLHRGAFAVRPLPDARRLGALARPFPDRDQPAPVRDPRPGEHERDVRQRAAGRARPAQLGRPDRRGSERLPGAGRGRSALGRPTDAASRGDPERDGDAGPQRPADPVRRLRRPGPARRRRGRRAACACATCDAARRVALRGLPGRRRRRCPSPSPTSPRSASSAEARWGWSTRPGTTTTGRLVALKLIVPESAAARSAVDRFLREMSVISQLKHPNIVEWLEQGMTRGQFWFAMEYVQGTNLEAVAQAEPGQIPREPGLPDGLPGAQGAGAGARAWGSSTATSSPRTS